MDDKLQKETIHGYEIQRTVLFENNRGFALAENPNAAAPFVTWQFTQDENGVRDYYWGHYLSNKDTAKKDYELRITDYAQRNKLSEVSAYKYYSTQRPVDIGTFPETENGPIRFENFDKREAVEQGQFQAWGYLVYDKPLSTQQLADYEFRAAPGNPDIVDIIQGYKIKQLTLYEKRWGFILAENLSADMPFATWQFTQDENGERDCYWGRYFICGHNALRDFVDRNSEPFKNYDTEEDKTYRYYPIQQRIFYNTFPKPNGDPKGVVCFDKPAIVENGRFKAWGYIDYEAPLTEKQINDYGLRPSRNNPDIIAFRRGQTKKMTSATSQRRSAEKQKTQKPIAEQFAEAAKKVRHDKPTPTGKKAPREER